MRLRNDCAKMFFFVSFCASFIQIEKPCLQKKGARYFSCVCVCVPSNRTTNIGPKCMKNATFSCLGFRSTTSAATLLPNALKIPNWKERRTKKECPETQLLRAERGCWKYHIHKSQQRRARLVPRWETSLQYLHTCRSSLARVP